MLICKTVPSFEPERIEFRILSCAIRFHDQRTLTSSMSTMARKQLELGKAIDKLPGPATKATTAYNRATAHTIVLSLWKERSDL